MISKCRILCAGARTWEWTAEEVVRMSCKFGDIGKEVDKANLETMVIVELLVEI